VSFCALGNQLIKFLGVGERIFKEETKMKIKKVKSNPMVIEKNCIYSIKIQ